MNERIDISAKLYDYAVSKYDPYVKIALVSGGDDSITMLEVLRLVGRVDYVVHVDTTCGLQETTRFVERYCDKNKLELLIPRTPEETYEEIVLQCGFPGPAQHGTMYIRLKERALRTIQRRFQLENSFCRIHSWDTPHKNGNRRIPLEFNSDWIGNETLAQVKKPRTLMYFTGARRDESIRRMSTVQDISKDGNVVWVNLIADWTKTDIHNFQQTQQIERNPVSILVGMSGECGCGSFADQGELALKTSLFKHDKSIRLIHRLQDDLKKMGHKYCMWGHRGNNDAIGSDQVNQPLCSTCINNQSHG